MNIRDCEYIIAVDELKSFVKAAQKCFISQPALSQQIKKVEDFLGIKIFERNNKTIITTNQGKKVIELSKEIVRNFYKLKKIKQGQTDLKIALIPTICPYLLPHLIEGFNQNFSEIKFYFLEEKTSDLLEKLKNGEIDIGVIAYFEDLIDSKTQYLNLYEEDFVLALPKNSAKTIDDLPKIISDKEIILLSEGNCISDNIRDICSIYSQYSQNAFNDFQATNIETVKNMIRLGNGVGLLPILSCINEANIQIKPFKTKKSRKVVLVFRKNYDDKGLIKKIAEVITNCATERLN